LKIFYADKFAMPLPAKHTFPVQKYALLRKRLLAANRIAMDNFHVSPSATLEEITRVHDEDYVRRLFNGELTSKELRPIGLPWSEKIVERARRSAGGTIAACRSALLERVSVNLGGGTHHAFCDRGQGYCILNDAAIAVRALQAENRVNKVLIVDCDVHQGNGTAALFKNDSSVFTFSIHGKRNFPYKKEKSDLDIALDDGTGDDQYLAELERGLACSIKQIQSNLVIYLAGADPFENDRFGRLALTKSGLALRDRLVFQNCHAARLPVAVTMAGGYSRDVNDIVDIHFQTVAAAVEFEKQNAKDNIAL
jgi:acetoin utilization deacetylase AcuC-like enzyme